MLSLDETISVLASSMRRGILEILSRSDSRTTYTMIWRSFGLPSTGRLNHHLRTLVDQGLVARQEEGYALTAKGKIASAISTSLKDSFRKHALGDIKEGPEREREILVKPFQEGDMLALLIRAGTMTSKGPLTENRVREEMEKDRQGLLELEARGIHGQRISSTASLVAVEGGHVVGNIAGEEERIQKVGHHSITIRSIQSFGDPCVSKKLISALLEYARRRGAKSVHFSLDNTDEVDEINLQQAGAKLAYEAQHKHYNLQLTPG